MRCKKLLKRIALSVLTLGILTSCSSSQKVTGNLKDVALEEGDVFAVISIQNYGDITVKLFPDIAPLAVEQFTTLAQRKYYDGKTIHRVIKDTLIQGGSLDGSGGDGNVDENEYFKAETSNLARHFNGALCFAKGEKGNYSQFYFVSSDKPLDLTAAAEKIRSQLSDEEIAKRLTDEKKKYYDEYCRGIENTSEEVKEKYKQVGGVYKLDGTDTVFGQVVEGMDIIKAISEVSVVSGNNIDDVNDVSSKPEAVIIIEKVEIVNYTLTEGEKTTA